MFNFKSGLILTLSFISLASLAEDDTKFPMGEGIEKWGVEIKSPDSDLALRLGGRLQSLMTLSSRENLDTHDTTTSQDFQARRVRFQFEVDLPSESFFYMDIRNDNANEGDEGEKSFNVGDAYVSVPLKNHPSHSLRAYRAKVDVARTQTVSSSKLLFLNRARVADEAAQFVNHNRRATNLQIIGNFHKKVSYQLVMGDGVYSDKFHDAKGEPVKRIERQNFMVGGKLRFHPVNGWEDLSPTETYFGEGKHFAFGAGAFNTSNIHIVGGVENTDIESTVSRNLLNLEVSGHYQELSLMGEYFKMDGVIENHNVTDSFNLGESEGWFVQGEWVFTQYDYLAPFMRYEKWNRFIESGDYESEGNIFGLNWYLNGNRFRVALAYQVEYLGRDISGDKEKVEAYHLTSMWHF